MPSHFQGYALREYLSNEGRSRLVLVDTRLPLTRGFVIADSSEVGAGRRRGTNERNRTSTGRKTSLELGEMRFWDEGRGKKKSDEG